MLLHLVDGAAGDVVRAWRTVREELAAYGGGLADKPELIGLNKADAMTPREASARRTALAKASGGAVHAAVRRHRAGRAGGAAGAAGRPPHEARAAGRRRRDRPVPWLAAAQRLVVKIGSALVVDPDEAAPRTAWLDGVAADIASLRARGAEVIVVSSGAIALARRTLGLHQSRLRLEEKQAAAAVGQIRLAQAWSEALSAKGLTAAQLLLTLDDTEDRRRYLNARATLNTLLGLGCMPVINENDTVATTEIRFGDNDRLAARVAEMMQADQLVLLSDIDGLYTADPRRDPAAAHIPVVAAHHAGDRGDGRRAAARLLVGRHAHQAGGGAHRHPGRLRHGDRLWPRRPAARARWRTARAAPGSCRARGALRAQALDRRRAGAARRAGGGCRRGARARRRAVAAAGRRARGRRHVRARRSGRGARPGRHGAGARPVGLCQRRCRTHRRPSLRRDRGDPRLARPRRDHPPRRPRAAVPMGFPSETVGRSRQLVLHLRTLGS